MTSPRVSVIMVYISVIVPNFNLVNICWDRVVEARPTFARKVNCVYEGHSPLEFNWLDDKCFYSSRKISGVCHYFLDCCTATQTVNSISCTFNGVYSQAINSSSCSHFFTFVTRAFSTNIGKSFSELKLVTDNFLFIGCSSLLSKITWRMAVLFPTAWCMLFCLLNYLIP